MPLRTPASSLPAALQKNADAASAAHVKRLAAEGRAAIAEVKACRTSIDGDYFAMGLAVKALKQKGVAQALGRADFAEICAKDLDLSVTKAAQLVTLVTRLTRATVQLLGRDRACAMMALVDATPDDDSVDELITATLRLPSGRKLVVADASTEAVWSAAKEFRLASGAAKQPARGFTASAAERTLFAKATKRWQRKDLAAAVSVELKATRKTHGAEVAVRMPLALWATLAPPPRGSPVR